MFNYQGPMLWTAYLFHDSTVTSDEIVNAIETRVALLREKPVDQATLERALIKMRSSFYDSLGDFNGFGRADMLASFALFDDDPKRINTVEEQFQKVTPELIQKTAAEYLRPTNRTVLLVEPKPMPATGPKSG
jgi:zinc protease